jgi:hypothetical protein
MYIWTAVDYFERQEKVERTAANYKLGKFIVSIHHIMLWLETPKIPKILSTSFEV